MRVKLVETILEVSSKWPVILALVLLSFVMMFVGV